MASLLETKKKIKSVKQTRKITKAMQLVSASKMRVFQRKATASRSYAWDLLNVLKKVISREEESSLLEKRSEGKHVFVLYSSEKGLCGALNTKLSKALIQSPLWKNTPESERMLITIGRKAEAFAEYNNIPVGLCFKGIKEDLTAFEALEFIQPLMDLWQSGEAKQISMIAPHYKSAMTFYPMVKSFLPFSLEMIQEHIVISETDDNEDHNHLNSSQIDFRYLEPSPERVSEVLFDQIIQSLFLQAFFELKAAEYSSRMMAMQNATDNATEMIHKLTLQFNKARQAKITQELAEISGALAAMN